MTATVALTVAAITAVAVPVVALGVLTAMGGRRRGAVWPVAALGGVVFPLTWAVWYVRDEPARVPRRSSRLN